MTNDYYKYKKYKKLYKQKKVTIGGNNNCNDIIKSGTETDDEWETRCRDNTLCVINNESRKCQANPTNIAINIKEMTGESYHVMIHSPYTVDVLFRMLSQEKRRCKLFREGDEVALPMGEDLEDGELIYLLPNPPVTPIMSRVALRGLVEIWCPGGFTDELLDTYGHISEWDVGNITDMNDVFSDYDWENTSALNITNNFNDNISEWDVSNVTTMRWMFSNATNFNQPLNNWDVSNVDSSDGMFSEAISFNQPLNNWDVSNVIDMSNMFSGANNFDPNNAPWYNFNDPDV